MNAGTIEIDGSIVVSDGEVLAGGVANAGSVVRVGPHVLRPSNANSTTIHALLSHLRSVGFEGVPQPVAIEADGRERLDFIPGDVPIPPFPAWSQTDQALASTAALLRRFHDATVGFTPPPDARWSDEMADPEGGPVIGHNDVCLENVVYRNGRAVALLDFDFAAPAKRVYDLAAFARMCVPIDTLEDAALLGWDSFDPFHRLRVVADAYGLPLDRLELVEMLDQSMRNGGAFVERRIAGGEQAFIEMYEAMGGRARYERRAAWFATNREQFLEALA